MNRTSSVETVHILHFCQCSHQFYSLEHSTPFRSPLQCRPGCRRHLLKSVAWIRKDSEAANSHHYFQVWCWNSKLLMLENLFVLHPSRSIEHSVNLCFKRTASMFLKFFCSPVLLYELQDVGATAFPSKRQTRFEVPAACLECGRAFFLFVLFFGSLAPVEDNNEKKNAHSHTANDRQTNSNNTKK